METTPQNAIDARAINSSQVYDRSLGISDAASDLFSAVEIASRYMLDAVEIRAPHPEISITPGAQRRLLFILNEAETRARDLSIMTKEQSEFWYEFHQARYDDVSDNLEIAIRAFMLSYDAWCATSTNGNIPKDTPEEDTFDKAHAALIATPCISMDDVRVKAELFITHDFLKDSCWENVTELLQSFIGVSAGAA